MLARLMLNFDHFTVKHSTQNIQNYCQKWLSDSFKVHQIHFRPGLCPGPHWGSLRCSPGPLAGLRGPTSRGEREEREKASGRKGRGEGERKGRGGTGPPPLSQIPGSAPVSDWALVYELDNDCF